MTMADQDSLFIGLDVGGASVKMGLFDAQGDLIGRGSVPTPTLIDAAGYEAVTEGISKLFAASSADNARVRGIELAIPCPVPADGVIRMQANIQISTPGLEAALQRQCPQAAIRFESDANAAAMGELWTGTAQGKASCMFVTVGTGVGGGIVVDGKAVSGAVGAGGEIGHLCLNSAEDAPATAAARGTWSSTPRPRSYKEECAARGTEPIELAGPSDSRSVFAVAKVGDEAAWAAIDIMCDYLGRALSIIANVVDPEAFVLGGGTSNFAVLFLDRLGASYRRYALPVTSEAPIELASLGNDAGIYGFHGAAYVALRAVGDAA